MGVINKNIEFEFKVMQKFQLNAEEWMLAKLLMTKLWSEQDTSIERYYKDIIGGGVSMAVLSSLMSKNVIEPIDIATIKYINDIYDIVHFTEVFNEFYNTDLYKIGDELWSKFPSYMSVLLNGRRLPAKNISKKFNDDTELFEAYHKQIGGRVDEHRRIMNIIDAAKSTGKVSCGIAEFVISKQWDCWEDLINEEDADVMMLKEFGNDLWNMYPAAINGFPMKNITKMGYHSVDAFNKFYFESIGYDKEEHKRILGILKSAIDQNLIGFGIYEFVATRKWDDLAKQMNTVSVTAEHVTLFKEVYALYPDTEFINGNETPLKVITNSYKDFDAIAKDYYNAIAMDSDVHEMVIIVIKKAKESGLLNMSLANFVKNRMWISLANS